LKKLCKMIRWVCSTAFGVEPWDRTEKGLMAIEIKVIFQKVNFSKYEAKLEVVSKGDFTTEKIFPYNSIDPSFEGFVLAHGATNSIKRSYFTSPEEAELWAKKQIDNLSKLLKKWRVWRNTPLGEDYHVEI
jgi:hypothetical protein